jgi:hypothetical protein
MSAILRYQATFNCISESCFPQQNGDLAHLVHQYIYDKQAPVFLIDQMSQTPSVSSNLLVDFLTENMRQISGFENCRIKNVDTVLKVCRYMMTNLSAFKRKPEFFNWEFRNVPMRVLSMTTNIQSTNRLVSIEMEHLFTYHTQRDPETAKDENEHNRFLMNPQRKQFFNFRDTVRLIRIAVQSGVLVAQLHSKLLVPRKQIAPKDITTSSLQEYYHCIQLEHLAEIT